MPTSECFRESLNLHRDRSGAVKAVPMEAAVPTPVPPVDGCTDPVPFGPSSSPPHQVHILGTSPPHLHPRTEQPPEAPPSHPLPSSGCAQAAVRAKPSTAPAPYLPMVRFPTMWPDFTSMTADTLLVWGERAHLRQCSPHLTPNQTCRGTAPTSQNAAGPLPIQGHVCTQR